MVRQVFSDHPDIFSTIHCAALIVVPESVARPYDYYRDNVVKSMTFFKLLSELGYPRVVFSSSAAIYDVVPGFMVTEESPLRPLSPYSRKVHDGNDSEGLRTRMTWSYRVALLQPDWRRPPDAQWDAYPKPFACAG